MNGARGVAKALLAIGAVALASLTTRAADDDLRAAAALTRFADATTGEGKGDARPSGPGSWFRDFGREDVDVTELPPRPGPAAPPRSRLYAPRGTAHPPALVLVPGVHRLGIDEPRLVACARMLASLGILVMTPELAELASFHLGPGSVDDIGHAARFLAERQGIARVGLMGISFGGGLAIVAATDPRYDPAIAFVVTLGAHDDLTRVLHYFVTGTIPRPDGSLMTRTPHEYGPLVVLHDHVDVLFAPADVPTATAVIGSWLGERFDEARARALDLSPEGRARMDAVFEHRVRTFAPQLLDAIGRNEPALERLSPSAHLARLHVPLFVLHGESDAVVPPTEAMWLAHDAPPGLIRAELVSRAIGHAEVERAPSLRDRLALVGFLAALVDEARRSAA